MNPRVMILPLLALLSGCGTVEQLSRVGRPPEMAPVTNPTEDPNWRPVTMPMPGPQDPPPNVNSIWRPGSRTFLRDQRASQVGDLITILVSIQDTANIGNETQRTRTGGSSMGMPQLFGMQTRLLPRAASPSTLIDVSSSDTSDGKGTIKRQDQVTLRVAATITQVLPNGNLALAGRQQVRVNDELRELGVQGVIRPQDIASDNTVQHDRLAEARIAYGGRGTLSDMQRPRYGQQVLDAVLPF